MFDDFNNDDMHFGGDDFGTPNNYAKDEPTLIEKIVKGSVILVIVSLLLGLVFDLAVSFAIVYLATVILGIEFNLWVAICGCLVVGVLRKIVRKMFSKDKR